MRPLISLLACALATTLAHAQEPPVGGPETLEPGVDTSAPRVTEAPDTAVAGADKSAAEGAPAPGAAAEGRPESAPGTPAGAQGAADAAARTAAPAAPAGGTRRVMDRLELDATQITGNRELPKVLYIVPWKSPDLGDLVGKPANSLLDEVLAPVDRDVFRRENRYYEALQPDAVQPGDKAEK